MCDNCVACNAIIARTQYTANDIRFEMSSIQFCNWNMKISSHYIFCSQRRYNVNFASFECAQLTLQFDVITLLSYAAMLWYSDCTIALHQRNQFEIFEMTIRRFNRFFSLKTEFFLCFNQIRFVYYCLFIDREFYRLFDRSFVR